jgi:hypothetical protein
MRKQGRWWDWALPGLICLCPMGAVAYYIATAQRDEPDQDSASPGRRELVSRSPLRAPAIRLARP